MPCEDHYIRPLVALSTAISPFWILCYLGSSALTVPGAIFCGTAQLIALYLLRYADDDKMPLITSVRSYIVFYNTIFRIQIAHLF